MYVFTKNVIIEAKFSHCPEIAMLRFGPNCTHFCHLLYVQLTWCETSASKMTRKNFGPQKRSSKRCYAATFFRQYFAKLLETFGVKILFSSTRCTSSMPIVLR